MFYVIMENYTIPFYMLYIIIIVYTALYKGIVFHEVLYYKSFFLVAIARIHFVYHLYIYTTLRNI